MARRVRRALQGELGKLTIMLGSRQSAVTVVSVLAATFGTSSAFLKQQLGDHDQAILLSLAYSECVQRMTKGAPGGLGWLQSWRLWLTFRWLRRSISQLAARMYA